MAAAKLNLKFEKGARFQKTLVWQDSSKVPVPLTGFEARMQVRDSINSAGFAVEVTSVGGDIVLEAGGNIGQIDITIGATVTDALVMTSGVYDIEIYDPADVDVVDRLVEGTVEVISGVTR